MGSRLSLFLPASQWSTSDKFCLGSSQGYSLDLYMSHLLYRECLLSVVMMLHFKARIVAGISFVPPREGGHGDCSVVAGPDRAGGYSFYFLATKHTGGFCPILNLSALNTFCCCCCFEVPHDWDLSFHHAGYPQLLVDCLTRYQGRPYIHVPIHPSHRHYLQFAVRNLDGDLIDLIA